MMMRMKEGHRRMPMRVTSSMMARKRWRRAWTRKMRLRRPNLSHRRRSNLQTRRTTCMTH